MAEGPGSSAPLKGMLCLVVGGALMTASDSVLKWLTSGYPVGQIMFLRGLFGLIPILIFVQQAGGIDALVTRNYRDHILRSGLMVGGTFLYVTGLRFLPLADVISIAFAGPLFITALASPMLGEHVGWRRWIVVLIGFTGIFIIFRPGGAVFQWAALFPLAASCTGALRDILTRKMSVSETSVSLLFYSTIAIALGGLVTAPFGSWQPVIIRDWLFFVLTGLLTGGAHFLMVEAFRLCEAALVAPFKYTSVLWAILFGYFIFREVPELNTLVGASVVISSGIYILHRERKLRRQNL